MKSKHDGIQQTKALHFFTRRMEHVIAGLYTADLRLIFGIVCVYLDELCIRYRRARFSVYHAGGIDAMLNNFLKAPYCFAPSWVDREGSVWPQLYRPDEG